MDDKEAQKVLCKGIDLHNYSTCYLLLNFFRRYSVDGKEACKHFSEVEAWYYDKTSANCQKYKICADKEILFLNR